MTSSNKKNRRVTLVAHSRSALSSAYRHLAVGLLLERSSEFLQREHWGTGTATPAALWPDGSVTVHQTVKQFEHTGER